MMRFKHGTRRSAAMAAVCLALLLGACNGSGDTASDSGMAPGDALSGGMNEQRGGMRGNVGLGGVEVRLLQSDGEVCQSETAPLQTTLSGMDGSYAFSGLDGSLSYCIGYEGNTLPCTCDWSLGDCECSAPSAP